MYFNKIIIVGGGSAGWMTAATLIHQFPEKEIILIESNNISTIGVGESTIGGINNWLSLLQIKDKDFMPHTDASYKLSIRFEDFYKKNSGAFHYPFGPAYTEETQFGLNDWYLKKFADDKLDVNDYANFFYPQMSLVNENKLFKNENNELPNFNFNRDTAYHFDATKFGNWLKDFYCLPRGVKYIKDDILTVEKDEEGIQSLNKKYKADLYIDCTGFKSLLLGETLKEPFESYADILPNNSAWATKIDYIDKEKELVSYTNCRAIENGWIWTIPLWSRKGTGYVYSDKYISDEDALKQFQTHLGRDDLEFKNIKMKIGIYNRLFVKNVCAIGLSAGFIEPLESNGLFTVHDFLLKLINVLKRGKISQWDRDTFNLSAKARFRTFAEFVSMHYAFSHRDDTQYWKDILNKSFEKNINNIEHIKFITGFVHTITDKMIFNKFPINDGIHCIATGMNYFPTSLSTVLSQEINPNYDLEKTKENFLKITKHLDERKFKWKQIIKNKKSLFNYLKDNIHNENSIN
jgi:hypothetical protein